MGEAFESIMRGLREVEAMESSRGVSKELEDKISQASELDLAKIGLNALIDEATGFQGARLKDNLRKQLECELINKHDELSIADKQAREYLKGIEAENKE
jgi:hypothetical protein